MHKKTIFTPLIQQFRAIGTGIRIACGMLTAALRSGYTVCALFLLNAVFFLYYIDVISRTLLGGGSFIARAIQLMIEFDYRRQPSGFTVNMDIPGVRWLLHFPEHFLVYALFALISLIMVHIVNSALERESCGVGRATFRAFESWRFIILYACFMSVFVWCIGDVYLMGIQFILAKMHASSILIDHMYEPLAGKKALATLMASHYWLPNYVRFMIASTWYLGTFLLFSVIANEHCSFLQGIWRSFKLTLHHMGLVLSAASVYFLIYISIIAGTIYAQAATLPSLDGLGTKSFVQVIALFAFMALILFMVHSALVSSGALIAAVLIYRMCMGQVLPKKHPFSTRSPYESCALYLIFYVFYWIVIRCGIHVQMPIF